MFMTTISRENLMTNYAKFHHSETNTKRDIHVQKIKVEKLV